METFSECRKVFQGHGISAVTSEEAKQICEGLSTTYSNHQKWEQTFPWRATMSDNGLINNLKALKKTTTDKKLPELGFVELVLLD